MVASSSSEIPWIKIQEKQPELFQNLNRLPARITINGKRHYHTPFRTGPAASVTTILSETASEANKKKLEMWSKANPGVKEAAAERGTAIHYGMECYLKGNKTPDIPEEYSDFWTGMPGILDQFDEVLWAETPLLERHQFTLSSDGIGRVWATDDAGRAWVGSPDIIGVVGGKLTLADLKTSVKPYSRKWPKDLEKGSPEWRDLLSGHMKFKKCLLQLVAYDLGIKQTLGMNVQQAAMLISTPERTQVFKISRNYLNVMEEKWHKLVEEYYTQVEGMDETDRDLI
jgi:hypothetical protein